MTVFSWMITACAVGLGLSLQTGGALRPHVVVNSGACAQAQEGPKPEDAPAKEPAPANKDDKALKVHAPLVPIDFATAATNRLAEALSEDFLIAHPTGRRPAGITPLERELIAASVRAGCERILSWQNDEGCFWVREESDEYLKGHCRALLVLLLAGYPTTDDKLEKGIKAVVKYTRVRYREGKMVERDPDGVEAVETRELYWVMETLYAVAKVRLHEKHAGAVAKAKEAKKPLPKAITTDRRKLAKELKAALTDDESKLVTEIRQTLLARQSMSKRDTDTGVDYAAGGFGDKHGEFGGFPMYSYHALHGLYLAWSLGFDPPLVANLELAADFLKIVQQDDGKPSSYSHETPKQMAKKDTQKPTIRKSMALGWADDVIAVAGKIGTMNRSQNGRDPAELSMTAFGVSSLMFIRAMATGGKATAVGTPIGKRVDDSIAGGLTWTLSQVTDCANRNEKPPQDDNEYFTWEGFPGHVLSAFGSNDLGVVVLGKYSGGAFCGEVEWYPSAARHWIGKLEELRKTYRQGVPDSVASEKAKEGEEAKGKAKDEPKSSDPPSEPPAKGKAKKEDKTVDPVKESLEEIMLVLLLGFDKTPGGADPRSIAAVK